jgi:hypothetical protein
MKLGTIPTTEVEATIIGSIGVHRRVGFARGYSASHVPTGTSFDTLAAGLKTQAQLIEWATLIQAMDPDAWAEFDSLPFGLNSFAPDKEWLKDRLVSASKSATALIC